MISLVPVVVIALFVVDFVVEFVVELVIKVVDLVVVEVVDAFEVRVAEKKLCKTLKQAVRA